MGNPIKNDHDLNEHTFPVDIYWKMWKIKHILLLFKNAIYVWTRSEKSNDKQPGDVILQYANTIPATYLW